MFSIGHGEYAGFYRIQGAFGIAHGVAGHLDAERRIEVDFRDTGSEFGE
jgi:hypothetical protein